MWREVGDAGAPLKRALFQKDKGILAVLQHLWKTRVEQFATIAMMGGGREVGYLAEERGRRAGRARPFFCLLYVIL